MTDQPPDHRPVEMPDGRIIVPATLAADLDGELHLVALTADVNGWEVAVVMRDGARRTATLTTFSSPYHRALAGRPAWPVDEAHGPDPATIEVRIDGHAAEFAGDHNGSFPPSEDPTAGARRAPRSVGPGSGARVRAYDRSRDLDAVKRIWREIGWATSPEHQALVGPFHDVGRTLVHEQDGAAEAACHVSDGTMRVLDTDLRLAAFTAVTTSHVARRQGAAHRLVAAALAREAADGAHLAALGIFDQGFYDRLGFGTGPYDHRFTFDPATLDVPAPTRPPIRVGPDDWREAHACLTARLGGHGAIGLDDPRLIQAELGWHDQSWGLGFRDEAGTLTHFVYGEAVGEYGPYRVTWMAYRSTAQLLELLGVLRSLGDQVHTVVMLEPPHLQLADLLRTPLREARKQDGKPAREALPWWQVRILDLPACVAAVHLPGHAVTFNLDVTDPAVGHAPQGSGWTGVAGRYVVTVGETSSAEPGHASDLPTLHADVGALSRLLLGVREASALAATGGLRGPDGLLADLDRTLRLPRPRPWWSF